VRSETAHTLMAFEPPAEPCVWPCKSVAYNPLHRLTSGLGEFYNSVLLGQQHPKQSHTFDNGRLWLSVGMPLLAHRFQYLRTISESNVSQIICAVDTYCNCSTSNQVAIKIMNAKHWALGAQEYERLRLLWRTLLQECSQADIVRPRTCFEHGNHFCIVFDFLIDLETMARFKLPSASHAPTCEPLEVLCPDNDVEDVMDVWQEIILAGPFVSIAWRHVARTSTRKMWQCSCVEC